MGDDLVVLDELLGVFERSLVNDLTARLFAPQFQIPVLDIILSAGEALFFCGCSAISTLKVGGTLPEPTVLALTNVDFSAH